MAELTPEQRQLFRDGGHVPPGWRWCPDCDGEGTVTTMGADPDLTEHSHPCTRCEAEHGIVPEPFTLDEDATVAAVDVIGRMGAKEVEVGYLDDAPRSEDARWWASATWNGTKVHVGNQRGPDHAAEALARRLLQGGQCTHCGGRVYLGGAPRAMRRHGKVCAWRRTGKRWERGCTDRIPEGQRSVPTPTRRGELPRPS